MAHTWPYLLLLLISVFISVLVAIYPLPPALAVYRPELLCLVVIYWVLHNPQHVGVGIAWCLGLLQDVIEGSVWGGHALALAFVAYICLMSYRRLRSYSLSQQTFWVFVFVGIHQLFDSWVQSLDGYGSPVRHIALSAFATAALWPILVICMGAIQRRYRLF